MEPNVVSVIKRDIDLVSVDIYKEELIGGSGYRIFSSNEVKENDIKRS